MLLSPIPVATEYHKRLCNDLAEADVRAFPRPSGMLAQAIDEPSLLTIEERVVDGSAPEIDSSYNSHAPPIQIEPSR